MTGPAIPLDFWNQYPTVLRPTQPPTALGGAGGLSGSELWRVDSRFGPLMVRAWPRNGVTPEILHQIHRWLIAAERLDGLAIPIASLGGATWVEVQGRFWELTPFLPGLADLGRPPTTTHLASMFQSLAAFHDELSAETVRGRSPGLIARSVELNRLILGEFATFQTALDRSAEDSRRPIALRWLIRARQVAPRLVGPLGRAAEQTHDLQPCIRDVRPDHFLFEGDKLTGLVDFGAMGIDVIATDLARLLGETVGRSAEHRRITFGAYEFVRPISESDWAILPEFEVANALLGGARWVRWHFVEHRRFADPDAVAQGLNRTLARLVEHWGPGD